MDGTLDAVVVGDLTVPVSLIVDGTDGRRGVLLSDAADLVGVSKSTIHRAAGPAVTWEVVRGRRQNVIDLDWLAGHGFRRSPTPPREPHPVAPPPVSVHPDVQSAPPAALTRLETRVEHWVEALQAEVAVLREQLAEQRTSCRIAELERDQLLAALAREQEESTRLTAALHALLTPSRR